MRALALVSVVVLSATACERAKAPPMPAASASGAGMTRAAPATRTPGIAKVVFIDKENACDCTRKRIEATWAALQSALGQAATLTVERIHGDTESAKAEAYTTLKPLMVPPGVYFVDASDAVIEVLQGEVTAAQIAAVLKRK